MHLVCHSVSVPPPPVRRGADFFLLKAWDSRAGKPGQGVQERYRRESKESRSWAEVRAGFLWIIKCKQGWKIGTTRPSLGSSMTAMVVSGCHLAALMGHTISAT